MNSFSGRRQTANGKGTFKSVTLSDCWLCLLCLIMTGCTDSPFGNDEITGAKDSITGRIILSDSASAEGTVVWLEGFDIVTRADENGEFLITLPSPATQSDPDGITGGFNVYYYMANYELNTTKIATRNGVFIYGQGEINENGELEPEKNYRNS